MAARTRPPTRNPRSAGPWRRDSDAGLLSRRVCDLDLSIEESPLQALLDRVNKELAARDLRFRPYAWLSSDWFTPDGVTGFAIPFTLADRRLIALERRQLLTVEGGTQEQCLRILRHETAHALDNAFGLHGRRDWTRTFGRFSAPYAQSYAPDPSSRDHVLNLSSWYGQSHPCEDWAETFAVWLDPSSRWRERYAGWPALTKLEYVDGLMRGLAGRPAQHRTRRVEDPSHRDTSTLAEHFQRKRTVLDEETIPAMDDHLRRLFAPSNAQGGRQASAFLRKHRRALVRGVAQPLGHHAYLVDQVAEEMILRCQHLRLKRIQPEQAALLAAAALLTALTNQFTFGAHPRYSR